MSHNINPSKLRYVKTEEVLPNPHNPRMLFDKEPLQILQDSIHKVGILSPLLIYERKKDGKLVILDGQRRWMCANNLGLKEIPANIIEEPPVITNILTMFNIHNIREPWALMPTALKLEVVMRELKTKSELKISKLTALSKSNVGRCIILLSYSKEYQDMMLSKEPKERIKADFFIEMHPVLNLIEKNLPHVSKEYNKEKIIQTFLKKYKEGSFTNVLHFRDIANIIRSIKKGVSLKKVEDITFKLLTEKEFNLKEYKKPIDMFYSILYYKDTFNDLSKELEEFEIKDMSYDEKLYKALLRLKQAIDKKITELKSLR